ncbi:MAG: fold metallo-hydrolase [Microbacteriaceae bacterium]|jgi:L-ascorbate metabolism protein UlaG (beta-lactamase superfamily)|nr:fold metallo-hydrolase [Microbacteriaceae bacterium]
MKLTHYGHACVLIETDKGARILIDPGTLSHGFESLQGLDAILVTHNHDDHLDVERALALIAANPGALVLADPESAPTISARSVAAGERIDVGGSAIEIVGEKHAPIYENIPGSANVAYLIDGGAFYHPGDSFEVPAVKVDVLALPIGGPWMKLADAIDYLRAVKPRIAVPIHEANWTQEGTAHFMIGHFTPEGTTFSPVQRGVATEV